MVTIDDGDDGGHNKVGVGFKKYMSFCAYLNLGVYKNNVYRNTVPLSYHTGQLVRYFVVSISILVFFFQ